MVVALSRLSSGLKMYGKFYNIFPDHKLFDANYFFKISNFNFFEKISVALPLLG